ncbi:MAG: SEC-C metal-binding domain-containing protein [Bdellovibrionota bacterium]
MTPAYPGDKAFSALLIEARIPMDIHTVRAFLTGFVLGPEYVPLQFAADEIMLVGTDREIRFDEPHLREQILASLQGLWNEITDNKATALKRIRPLPESFDNYDYLVAYLNSLCEDAALFMGALEEAGLSLDDQSWSDESLEASLEELEAFLAQAENFLDALGRKKFRSKSDFSKLVRELCVLHDVWEISFLEICAVLRRLRAEGKSPLLGAMSISAPTAPRMMGAPQATCSCGSGKTFRECCMLKLVN